MPEIRTTPVKQKDVDRSETKRMADERKISQNVAAKSMGGTAHRFRGERNSGLGWAVEASTILASLLAAYPDNFSRLPSAKLFALHARY